MSLIKKLVSDASQRMPAAVTIRITSQLSESERNIRDLLFEANRCLGARLDPTRTDWEKFAQVVGEADKKLEAYDGRFAGYFANYRASLRRGERVTLGYD